MNLNRSQALVEIDRTLAILGCFFAIGLTAWLALNGYRFIYVVTGVVPFVACVAYLFLRKRLSVSVLSLSYSENKPSIYLTLNILFFLLLSYSILSIYQRPEVYERPLGYFISISLMSAVVAVEILLSPSRKAYRYLTLLKMIVIALSLAWSQQLLFPGVLGADTWYHQRFTSDMLGTGHIPQGALYSKLPSMHLIIGSTSIVADIDYRTASMLSMNLLQVVIDITFVFLLGRFMLNARAGLFAALALALSSYHIAAGIWMVPSYAAMVFIPIILYLLLKLRRQERSMALALSILMLAALLITHALTSLVMAVILILGTIGIRVYRRIYSVGIRGELVPIGIILTSVFIAAMLCFWTFVTPRYMQGLTEFMATGSWGAPLVQTGLPPSEEFIPVGGDGLIPPGDSGLPTPGDDKSIPPGDSGLPPPGDAGLTPPGGDKSIQPGDTESVLPKGDEYMRNLPSSEQLFNQTGLFIFIALAFMGSFWMLSKEFRNENGFVIILTSVALLSIAYFGLALGLNILPGRWLLFSLAIMAIPTGVALSFLFGGAHNRVVKVSLLGVFSFGFAFIMIMIPQANIDNPILESINSRPALTESEMRAVDAITTKWDAPIATDLDYLFPFAQSSAVKPKLASISDSLLSMDFSDYHNSIVVIREYIIHHTFGVYAYLLWQLDYDPRQLLAEQGFSTVYAGGSVSGFVNLNLE